MATAMHSTQVELQHWSQLYGGPQTSTLERDRDAGHEVGGDVPDLQDHGVFLELKPVDGGLAAWRVLIAAFIFEALLWGFPISFGVFQDYYSALPEFQDNSNIALIGTISQGMCYLGAPLSAAVTKRFPKYQRLQIYVGWPLCIGGLVAGSFTNSLGGLIATQGVMYGVGFVTFTYPIISMVNEWWLVRKGMAFGLISAASGASGAIMPFVLNALLERYGHQTTLRIIAVGMTILTAPFIPFLKARLPPSAQSSVARTNWSFLKIPLFYVYAVSVLIQGIGFFFPPIYLPSMATACGLSTTSGALLLAIMAIAQVAGQFAFGWLSDKNISVSILCAICSIMAAIATFGLWGPAHGIGLFVGFSILYGVFGYAFSTLRVAMGKAVSPDGSSTLATYSIMVFLQGVGNISAGPLSAALIRGPVELENYGLSKYQDLVIFTGTFVALIFYYNYGTWMSSNLTQSNPFRKQ